MSKIVIKKTQTFTEPEYFWIEEVSGSFKIPQGPYSTLGDLLFHCIRSEPKRARFNFEIRHIDLTGTITHMATLKPELITFIESKLNHTGINHSKSLIY